MHSESQATSIGEKIERSRLERRITQDAVAQELGITQPHYSKVVRGAARLTEGMHEKMENWLEGKPPIAPASYDEITSVAKRIERDMARLNHLLTKAGLRISARARPEVKSKTS